jgi:hypothetical protein
MNEKTQLSPKEWQLISAYLDDQVSPRERIQIEKRLASEDAFRQAMQSLRQTRAVIRAMPRRRVPRNFTLTPEMVPVKRKSLLFPVLRYSSAFAAIASILLFAMQLLPSRMVASAPAAAPLAMEMATAAEEPASAEPPLIFWGEPGAQAEKSVGGYGGGGGMGGGAPDTIFSMPYDAATPSIQFEIPQATSEPGIGAAEAGANAAPAFEATPYPTPTPYVEGTEAPALEESLQATAAPQTLRGQATSEGNLVLGLRPEDYGEVIAESQPDTILSTAETEPSISLYDLILPSAIGLAVLAFTSGIAAFILWKKSRA